MKKQTIKSLIAFLIFNAAFLISAMAQIIYNDVIPDVTVDTNGGIYHLDLNNNGTTDFNISVEIGSTPGGTGNCTGTKPYARVIITSVTGNFFVRTSNSASALTAGAIINPNNVWSYDTLYMASNYWQCTTSKYGQHHWVNFAVGQWLSALNKYLGLKFIISGNTYYGWARLISHVNSNGTANFTIKDYAYNSIPNQQILAGVCPTPTVTLSPGGPLSICQGDNVTLTANGTGTQYQWKKNGVNINGAIQQTYVAKTAGTYNVIVTNGCGMSQTSNPAMVAVGLPCKNADASLSNNSDVLEHLSVYPNPATNSVTIKIPSDEAGKIQITNLFGRVVETHNYASLRDGELQIDVSKFPAGMYVVRWRSGDNFQTEKFSVMH